MSKYFALPFFLCLLLAACAPAATPTSIPPTTAPTLEATAEATSEATQAASPMTPTSTPSTEATSEATASTVEYLVPEVIATYPHDPASYTQGLVWHEGTLYESTGRVNQTYIRQVNPETGEVLRQIDVPDVFGEGIAIVDNRIIELTWQNEVAFVYDLDTFASVGSFTYTGQGWALCYDGEQLVMTDGSANLFFRDPDTFELVGQVPVTLDGNPIVNLNEIECVDDEVYANVWLTDTIMRIDKATGNITAVIDAVGLLTEEERAAAGHDGVLNGIAYVPEDDVFFITGKLWSSLFKVRFVPSDEDAVG
jgi:glutaminyl-peptide cyclotransferase